MREINFRVWDKNTNKMIGIYDPFELGALKMLDYKREDLEIMQYTGLKDESGKEIYESDIVQRN